MFRVVQRPAASTWMELMSPKQRSRSLLSNLAGSPTEK
uniref:Uncharacterized protein n=1 Tax=Arundo donax TaxID=35708 RepID=A0A0A9C4V7_ARUDO